MITRESFKQKVHELWDDYAKTALDYKIEKALTSGCFDLENAEDDYILPKMFMSALGKDIEWNYKPHNNKDLKEVNNIYRMI